MWQRSHKSSLEEERKLELRLGPPGEDESYNEKNMKNVKKERDESQPSCTNLTNKSQKSGSSSKSPTESQHAVQDKVAASNKPISNSGKGLFVKINMDGIPIGRKVDINAYDSYEKLSSAVDDLFRGLLEEINLSHDNKQEEDKGMMKGSLIGSGEYTLVYEDNEGDKMLVGDVPWHMFVSTVKRLRVSKSSDLPAFNREFYSF
ncbi:hypothetical protein TSUD_355890 [Trifolium subterraneum]|uniref:Auxin-induced protein n=1 Tax=Trifolium subterraneum TaxID=3900 RepID=A0A2Z6MME6_TRISU|nr:hypothetical protein TSUD_355890 [Trifolium subterraneum]